jgi:hypothetical protein
MFSRYPPNILRVRREALGEYQSVQAIVSSVLPIVVDHEKLLSERSNRYRCSPGRQD